MISPAYPHSPDDLQGALRYLVQRNIKLEECVATLLDQVQQLNKSAPVDRRKPAVSCEPSSSETLPSSSSTNETLRPASRMCCSTALAPADLQNTVRNAVQELKGEIQTDVVAAVRAALQQELKVGAVGSAKEVGELCTACKEEVAAEVLLLQQARAHTPVTAPQLTPRPFNVVSGPPKPSGSGATFSTNALTQPFTPSSSSGRAADTEVDAAFKVLFDTFSLDNVTVLEGTSTSTPTSSSRISRALPAMMQRANESSVSDLLELRAALEPRGAPISCAATPRRFAL